MPKSNKGKPIQKDEADLQNHIWPYSNMWHFGCTQKSHWLLFKAWQIDGQLHISFPQNGTIKPSVAWIAAGKEMMEKLTESDGMDGSHIANPTVEHFENLQKWLV
jgi:hypothetical protein